MSAPLLSRITRRSSGSSSRWAQVPTVSLENQHGFIRRLIGTAHRNQSPALAQPRIEVPRVRLRSLQTADDARIGPLPSRTILGGEADLLVGEAGIFQIANRLFRLGARFEERHNNPSRRFGAPWRALSVNRSRHITTPLPSKTPVHPALSRDAPRSLCRDCSLQHVICGRASPT